MRKIVTTLALAVIGMASLGRAQNINNENVGMVMTNKTDLAFARSPFIVGESCNYMFNAESNTLMADCYNNEGMIAGT